MKNPPLSAISLAKAIWSPKYIFKQFLGNPEKYNFSKFNIIFNEILKNQLGSKFWIPSFLYDPKFQYVINILSLALCVKIFDELYRYTWKSYLLEHQAEFYDLLNEYNGKLSELEISKLDEKLKLFIKNGNSIKSIFPGKQYSLGIDSLYSANARINFYKRLPIYGAIGIGLYKLIKSAWDLNN